MAQPTRTRTRLDRAMRRDQILDATVDVLRDRDLGEVTFEDIADAAGVSRALLYNYFGDRRGLIEALEERTLEHLDEGMEVAGAGTADASIATAIGATVRAHLDLARRDPAGYRLLATRSSEGGLDAEQVRRAYGPLVDVGATEVVDRGLQGALRAMVLAVSEQSGDASAAAAVITAFLVGALTETDERPDGAAAGLGDHRFE
jgi:AcrR family transcriptional regulator